MELEISLLNDLVVKERKSLEPFLPRQEHKHICKMLGQKCETKDAEPQKIRLNHKNHIVIIAPFNKWRRRSQILTEKLGSLDHQTSVEAAHTYARESEQLHNSSNIWPSKTLEHPKKKKKTTIKMGNLRSKPSVVT